MDTIDPLSGILTLVDAPRVGFTTVNGLPVRTPAGTKSYGATINVGGVTRRYVVVRPDPAPASAPLLLVLHPTDTTPELTANFTFVADFVESQGFWAVMPEAEGGTWKAEPLDGEQDKNFLAALIDVLVSQGVDRERVSVAGYSSGGGMAERMACEMADRVASIGVVAATLPLSLYLSCTPSVQRPKVYVLGTDDELVPYYGLLDLGLGSAAVMMDFWASRQGCSGSVVTPLPDIENDGTTVQREERTGCTGNKTLQLYTVENGGHAWPGGTTDLAGRTSRDMSATGVIWNIARTARR